METIITLSYKNDGDLILAGYDEKGAIRDLKDLIGQRIVKIEGMYDDILVISKEEE